MTTTCSDKFLTDVGESSAISFEFVDSEGLAIDTDAILAVSATLRDKRTASIINSRDSQNILNVNGGSLGAEGTFSLSLSSLDNVIVSPDSLYPGESEEHLLTISWTWLSSDFTAKSGKHSISVWVRMAS